MARHRLKVDEGEIGLDTLSPAELKYLDIVLSDGWLAAGLLSWKKDVRLLDIPIDELQDLAAAALEAGLLPHAMPRPNWRVDDADERMALAAWGAQQRRRGGR